MADFDLRESTRSVAGTFANTRWSVILSAASKGASGQSSAALDQLCQIYWPPLYAYLRRQGETAHDAQDLTQEFFARLLEKDYLAAVDQSKGRFRSFLLRSEERR